MEHNTFQRFRDIIYQESGISLGDEKASLVMNRISKRLCALGIPTEKQYLEVIESNLDGEELMELIDCISTNVTYFYREQQHFVFFDSLLKEWKLQHKKSARIWCAASSSGEEPYSIAMCVAEVFGLGRMDCKILATDICTRVLKKAVRGRFDPKQLRDLPQAWCTKYFSSVDDVNDVDALQIDPQLQKLVTFRKLNLSRVPYPLKGPLDVIFCRNVMIYFDLSLRKQLIKEFSRLLAPNGYLIVGHSENLLGIEHNLKSVQSGVYRKPL